MHGYIELMGQTSSMASINFTFFDLAHCGLLVLSMTECTNVILMGQKPVGLWTSQIRPQRLQMNLVLEVTAEMK